MSYLWHGYVAFQKPGAVGAVAWAAALVALKAELDETPAANQPAERWHSVTSSNTTIAEATFDLYKLNTANLTAVAGVDMTDAWEPLACFQAWSRSRLKAISLVVDRAWNLSGYTAYLPEDYGTVDGDPVNDTAAIQAAIDAAVAAGSGRVVCNGTYNLAKTGTITSALATVDYALWINGDDVGLEGTGTLNLTVAPVSTKFVAVAFGNGGGNAGAPGESGTWIYNNWLKDLTIDGSALSDAEREAISAGATSHTAVFMYCQDWYMRNVTVIGGWGGNAMLGSMCSSRYGYCLECDVQSGISGAIGANMAYWFDGARYICLIASLGETTNAFTFQANLDNAAAGYAQNNLAINCTFTGLGVSTGRYFVSITGSDDTRILDNSFATAAGQYAIGIMVVGFSNAGGTVTSSGCVIQNNTLTTTLADQQPVHINGLAGNPITGLQFKDNTITGYTRRGYFVDANCTGAIFSGNTYPVGTTTYGYASAGDETTIVANNVLQ